MDEIISRYNFAANRQEDFRPLHDDLERFRRSHDSFTVDMVTRALAALEKQVAKKDYPSEMTDANHMAVNTFRDILRMVQEVLDKSKDQGKVLHDALLDFVVKLFDCGPGSTHCKLISEVYYKGPDFKEFFYTLRGDKLVRVIKAMRRPFTTEEKEHPDRMDIELDPVLRAFLDSRTGFQEEQYDDQREQFVDLYLYYCLAFLESPADLYKRMDKATSMLRRGMDGNPFKKVQNVQVLREAMKSFSDHFCNPRFPQSDEVSKHLADEFKRLLDAINENGKFPEMYEDLMDFVEAVTARSNIPALYKVFEDIAYFIYHLKEHNVKNKPGLYETVMKRHLKFLGNLQDRKFLDNRYAYAMNREVLLHCIGTSKEHLVLWIQLLMALLKIPRANCAEAAYYALREKDKAIKWKEHEEAARTVLTLICEAKVDEDQEEKQQKETIKYYKDFADTFLDALKRSRMVNSMSPAMYQFGLGILEGRKEAFYELAREVVRDIDFNPKKDKEYAMDILRRLVPLLQDEDFPWVDEDLGAYCIATELSTKAFDCMRDTKNVSKEELEVMAAVFMSCATKEMIDPFRGTTSTVFFVITCQAGAKLSNMLNKDTADTLSCIVEPIIAMMEHEEETIASMGSAFVQVIGNQNGHVLAPFMERLLTLLLDNEVHSAMQPISQAYEHNPDPLSPRFQEVFDMLENGDLSSQFAIAQLLPKVAKERPELFTEDNVSKLVETAQTSPNMQYQILDTLSRIAAHRPELILDHVTTIIDEKSWPPHSMHGVCGILKHIAAKFEKESFRVTEYFAKILKGTEEQATFLAVLDGLRTMVATQRPAVENQKDVVVALRDRTKNQYIKDSITALIDLLEGRSLQTLSDEVQQTQDDVEKLDTRVTATEVAIVEVKEELEKQKHTIHGVQIDLQRQADKLQSYEDAMKEANLRIDQIDSKTLSHAPFWAKDVAKLMNKEAAHDWRLLSHRLGYSNDDIRGWAQQADPCLAMLNEWFATNKTSRAIYGVLTALQEINRVDAAAIVENAMKAMDKVVEEPAKEYASPPEVFLSYQWGHQNEVKLLKQHLEMAGFTCWMDIGQMGGGDKLFEKIDSGVRGAKVVLSCVSAKYARSPNCNREVQLSVATGKPIIPLLMEKMDWPPEGAMGPIFSEFLFIRFFQRPGEESGDIRYWPVPKFQELLMQLNLNGAKPDQKLVKPEYKNWWIPIVEEIKIEKKTDGGGSAAGSKPPDKKEQKAATSPGVFLSYQWGKQRQVLALYRRLTSLGLSCWMDIFQMGGGDSLYDKIDRGLRGCQVVVSCVTSKYAISANCRREVSLADALHKPLIPLLLESVAWPPPGPMSMVLSPLLYVNFAKNPEEQDTWDGPKFDELLTKLREHVAIPEDASPQKNGSTSQKSTPSTTAKTTDIKTSTNSSTASKTTTTTTTVVRKKPVAMKPASTSSGGGQAGVVVRAIPNVKVAQSSTGTATGAKPTAAPGKVEAKASSQQPASRATGKTQTTTAASQPLGISGRNPTLTAANNSTKPATQPSSTASKTGSAARKSSLGTGGNSSSKGPAGAAASTASNPKDSKMAAGGRGGARPDPRGGRAGAPGRSTSRR